MDILTLLDKLETHSGNAKLAELKKHKENELLKDIIFATLDPNTRYHIKIIPPYTSAPDGYTIRNFLLDLEQFSKRIITGNAAVNELASMLGRLSERDAIVGARIVKRDLRVGFRDSTANKVWPNILPKYPCLLARGYDAKTAKGISFPAYSQLKSDGMRANGFVFMHDSDEPEVYIRGRSGKYIHLHGSIDEDLHLLVCALGSKESMVFDGELLVVDDHGNILSRKVGNGLLNKAIQEKMSPIDTEQVRYNIWDVFTYSEFLIRKTINKYQTRFTSLETAFGLLAMDNKCTLIESIVCNNEKELMAHYDILRSRGEEGSMVKDFSGLWEDTRSKAVLKMKSILECDLEVIDWQVGTGKYSGILGALVCATKDRKLIVSVGSGFSDEQRKSFGKEMIGEIVEVRYNELIDSKGKEEASLFLPRFVEWRQFEKSEADIIENIK